jgi:hypothetical protein
MEIYMVGAVMSPGKWASNQKLVILLFIFIDYRGDFKNLIIQIMPFF